jgi:hypothetical protein
MEVFLAHSKIGGLALSYQKNVWWEFQGDCHQQSIFVPGLYGLSPNRANGKDAERVRNREGQFDASVTLHKVFQSVRDQQHLDSERCSLVFAFHI